MQQCVVFRAGSPMDAFHQRAEAGTLERAHVTTAAAAKAAAAAAAAALTVALLGRQLVVGIGQLALH
jgi:hypothetical protein